MRAVPPAIAHATARLLRGFALCLALVVALVAVVPPAFAQRLPATLDRQRIEMGETVTLTIDIDSSVARAGVPDFTGLAKDFRIVDQATSQQMSMNGGGIQMTFRLQLVLTPTHPGEIDIPPLPFGGARTPPLHLTVLPPRVSADTPVPGADVERGDGNGPVFIETKLDTVAPYVQQTVGYTVRLYYQLGTLLEGRLDQDPPDGASLQKVGDDKETLEQVRGAQYNLVERHFLLIPERAGRVSVPAPRFLGRISTGFGGAFGGLGGGDDMRVFGPSPVLQVNPIPADAPQPWLPLAGLQLRYLDTPRSARAGETALVTVQVVADGAVLAQLPDLALQVDGGAQVFPESAQNTADFVGGRPQATTTRRFAVLPTRAGTLRVHAPRITWWDAAAGVARTATLPDLVLPVAAARPGSQPLAGDDADDGDDDGFSWRAWMPGNLWAIALLPIGAIWLVALIVGLRFLSQRRREAKAPSAAAGRAPATATVLPDPQALATALARGDRAAVERALCALAGARDLDGVRARLVDPAQRDAVAALQRARWGRGDPAAAMVAMRAAFAQGPRWWPRPRRAPPSLLPPLYPER